MSLFLESRFLIVSLLELYFFVFIIVSVERVNYILCNLYSVTLYVLTEF